MWTAAARQQSRARRVGFGLPVRVGNPLGCAKAAPPYNSRECAVHAFIRKQPNQKIQTSVQYPAEGRQNLSQHLHQKRVVSKDIHDEKNSERWF